SEHGLGLTLHLQKREQSCLRADVHDEVDVAVRGVVAARDAAEDADPSCAERGERAVQLVRCCLQSVEGGRRGRSGRHFENETGGVDQAVHGPEGWLSPSGFILADHALRDAGEPCESALCQSTLLAGQTQKISSASHDHMISRIHDIAEVRSSLMSAPPFTVRDWW